MADPECARGVSHIFAEKRGVSFTLLKKNARKFNIFTNNGGGVRWVRPMLDPPLSRSLSFTEYKVFGRDHVLSGIYYFVLVRNTCQHSQQRRR